MKVSLWPALYGRARLLQIIFFPLIVVLSKPCFSQSEISTIDQTLIWIGGTGELKINPLWSIFLHAEERRFIFPDRKQQRVLPDVRVSRHLKKNWNVTSGLWVFNIYTPGDPFLPVNYSLREWRPYLSLSKRYDLSKGLINWRLQAEWRLFLNLDARNHFDGPIGLEVYRQRFFFSYHYPLKGNWEVQFSEELHLNLATNAGVLRVFDQNRLSVDFVKSVNKHLILKLGLMNWFQPTVVPSEYFNRFILTTGVSYTISLND